MNVQGTRSSGDGLAIVVFVMPLDLVLLHAVRCATDVLTQRPFYWRNAFVGQQRRGCRVQYCLTDRTMIFVDIVCTVRFINNCLKTIVCEHEIGLQFSDEITDALREDIIHIMDIPIFKIQEMTVIMWDPHVVQGF